MKTLKLLISGNVQGVGFRAFVKRKALKIGVRGYVKNLSDGKVETLLQGQDKDVDEMIEICKKGSFGSNVKDVEIQNIKGENLNGFEIRF
jgi:acylphosphatase